MTTNILSVIINNLINKIENREFYSNLGFNVVETNNLLNYIVKEYKNVLNYINHSEQEITRLNKEVTHLNSELVKCQLKLIEYKRESNS